MKENAQCRCLVSASGVSRILALGGLLGGRPPGWVAQIKYRSSAKSLLRWKKRGSHLVLGSQNGLAEPGLRIIKIYTQQTLETWLPLLLYYLDKTWMGFAE